MKSEVISLPFNLKKAGEKVVSAKAELDAFRAKAELVA